MFRSVAVAVAVVAVVTLAVLLLRTSGEADVTAPPPVVVAEKEPPETKSETTSRAAAVGPDVVAEQPAAPTTAPCAGCLDERAVLDVAGAFLAFVMPDHLGIRAERYLVSVPDDVDPDDVVSVSKFLRDLRLSRRPAALPAGLVDAPRSNPFGISVDFHSGLAGRGWSLSEALETWIVWIQIGWRSYATVERLVERGELPEVALSWPPLKRETYIFLNARTGEITSAIGLRGHLGRVDPRRTNLFIPGRDEARKRAAAWFAREQDGNPSGRW